MTKFAERLRKYRNERNITQGILGDDLGVTRQTISQWETSQTKPEMAKIIKLAAMMNSNAEDLIKDIIQ